MYPDRGADVWIQNPGSRLCTFNVAVGVPYQPAREKKTFSKFQVYDSYRTVSGPPIWQHDHHKHESIEMSASVL